jgi:putative tryptophan/tyrosine transport system substrate-binding protein
VRRRDFVALAGAAAAGPLIPAASVMAQSHKLFRVGLPTISAQRSTPVIRAFDARLRELGYTEGNNIEVDYRLLAGDVARFPAVMKEFTERPVDVIVAPGPEVAVKAAREATHTIPIVMMAIDYDPIARGYIDSLARPGGNITGIFLRQIELATKRLDLLKELLPAMKRVIVVWDEISADQAKAVIAHAEATRLQVKSIELPQPPPYDYERALATLEKADGDALMVMTSPVLFMSRKPLIELARRLKLPSSFAFKEFVADGGLVSYAPSLPGMFRLAADYVDRILKGAKPAELPVQQPTLFELVVNLKTAQALGIELPVSILARADEVIE